MMRGAPKVAAVNAAKAHENIRRKTDFFKTLLEKALLEHERQGATNCYKLPNSVRQFNLWTPIDDKGELLGHPIELTGEDTLCNAEGGQAAGTKLTRVLWSLC